MANVHNIIIRGLNSIVLQGPNISPRDRKSFVGFCIAWHRFVSHHHDSEETGFFTPLQEKIDPTVMAVSQAEHCVFYDGLDRYHAYLTSLKGHEDQLDAKVLLEIIDGFSRPLYSHLINEIGALLDLTKLDQEKLINDEWAEATKRGTTAITFADFVEMMPFALFAHDATIEGGLHKDFPPIPWPIQILMRYVASLWHRDWWKFSPCNKASVPKELYATGSE